jgi:CubicO group peptidase (beta-lactamase class C family)
MAPGVKDDLAELRAFHLRDQSAFGAPGSALLLMRDGEIVFEEYAGTDQRTGRPIAEGDRFNLYSVRKTYLGLALALALYDDRLSSIDERVSRFVPDSDGLLGETRIRHLLTYTHGLQRAAGGMTRAFEPGTNWAYSGVGIDLLVQVIQAVTDRSIAELMGERVFRPCGLNETGWESPSAPKLVADLHESDGVSRLYEGPTDGSARNLYASGREILRWGELHRTRGALEGEQLLPANLFEWATSVQSPAGLAPGLPCHGFCWWVQEGESARAELGPLLPDGSYQGLGANGCHALVIPAAKAVAVRLLNKIGNPPGYDYLPQVRQFGDLVWHALQA